VEGAKLEEKPLLPPLKPDEELLLELPVPNE
jgi:hypothetical protein